MIGQANGQMGLICCLLWNMEGFHFECKENIWQITCINEENELMKEITGQKSDACHSNQEENEWCNRS